MVEFMLAKTTFTCVTVRLSHKSANKNNVKEEFICLIFSNIYLKILWALLTKASCLK